MSSSYSSFPVATFTLATTQVMRKQYEVAAWFTDIEVPAGEYPIVSSRSGVNRDSFEVRDAHVVYTGKVVASNLSPLYGGVAFADGHNKDLGETKELSAFIGGRRLAQLLRDEPDGYRLAKGSVLDGDRLLHIPEYERTGAITVRSNDLLRTTGFDNGEMLDDVVRSEALDVNPSRLLRNVLLNEVIPMLDQRVEAMGNPQSGNPVRVTSVDGRPQTPQTRLTPETVTIGRDQILRHAALLDVEQAMNVCTERAGKNYTGKIISERGSSVYQETGRESWQSHPRGVFKDGVVPSVGQLVSVSYTPQGATFKDLSQAQTLAVQR